MNTSAKILHSLHLQTAIIAAVAFLLYANSIRNDFAYDDYVVFVENSAVQKGFAGIPEIWSGKTRFNAIQYRPLSSTLFAIEHAVFGNNPHFAHLVNAVLYAGLCALIAIVVGNIFRDCGKFVSFVTGLLFAAHPIHSEVVNNIKGADELLCSLFAFSCILAALNWSERPKCTIKNIGIFFSIIAILFLASCFSKESGLVFALLIPLSLLFSAKPNPKKAFAVFLLMLASAAIYLGWCRWGVKSLSAMATIDPVNNFLIEAKSFHVHLATAFMIIGRYLMMLVLPYPLVHDYGYGQIPFVSFADIRAVIPAIICTLLLIGALSAYKKIRPVSFAILFFFGSLSFISNIFYNIGVSMAERLLFVPSFGFCLGLSCILTCPLRAREKAPAIAQNNVLGKIKGPEGFRIHWIKAAGILLLLSAYAGITLSRNGNWKNSMVLFSHDIRLSPQSATLNASLGNSYLRKAALLKDEDRYRIIDTAAYYLRRAVTICPRFAYAHGNYGMAYYLWGANDSALAHFRLARSLDFHDRVSWVKSGEIFFSEGLYDSSIACYKQAKALDTSDIELQIVLGDIYCMTEHFCAGLLEYQDIVSRCPEKRGILSPRIEYARRVLNTP